MNQAARLNLVPLEVLHLGNSFRDHEEDTGTRGARRPTVDEVPVCIAPFSSKSPMRLQYYNNVKVLG